MTSLLIGTLAVIALYLGMRWRNARAENEQLRAEVAALKRRLARRGR